MFTIKKLWSILYCGKNFIELSIILAIKFFFLKVTYISAFIKNLRLTFVIS